MAETERGGEPLGFLGLLAALLALVLLPFFAFGPATERLVVDYFGAAHSWLAHAAIGAAMLAADPLLPVPSSVVATLLGARIGFLPAAMANGLGLSLGALIGLAAGHGARAVSPRLASLLPPGFAAWIRRSGIPALLVCRPVPVLAEASLVLAGIAGMRLGPALAWLVPAQVALGCVYAYAGAVERSAGMPGAALAAGAIGVPLAAALAALLLARRGAGEALEGDRQ